MRASSNHIERTVFIPPFEHKDQSGIYEDNHAKVLANERAQAMPAVNSMTKKKERVELRFRPGTPFKSKFSVAPKPVEFYMQLLDKMERYPDNGFIKNIGFEKDIARFRKDGYTYYKSTKFEDSWKELQSSLSHISEGQLFELLRNSIALTLSKDVTDQLKGFLIKAALNDEESIKAEKDEKRLAFRAAMVVVTSKIETVLAARKKNTSYEAVDYIRLLINEPTIDSAYYKSINFLKKLYPDSAAHLENEKNLSASQKVSEQRGQTHRTIISNHLGREVSDRNSAPPTPEVKEVDEIEDLTNYLMKPILEQEISEEVREPIFIPEYINTTYDEEEKEKFELARHLRPILGHYGTAKTIENEISRLEMMLGLHSIENVSRSALEGQVEMLLGKIPEQLLSKYLGVTNENEAKFNAKYVNNTDSFMALQWHNLDLSVPAKFMPVKQLEDSIHLQRNTYHYKDILGEAQLGTLLIQNAEMNNDTARRQDDYKGTEGFGFFGHPEFPLFKQNIVTGLSQEQIDLQKSIISIFAQRHAKKNIKKYSLKAFFDNDSRASKLKRDRVAEATVVLRIKTISGNDIEDIIKRKLDYTFMKITKDQKIKTLKMHDHPNIKMDSSKLNLFRLKKGILPHIVDYWIEMYESVYPYMPRQPDENRVTIGLSKTILEEPLKPVFQPVKTIPQLIQDLYEGTIDDSTQMTMGQKKSLEMLGEIEKDNDYRHYFESALALLTNTLSDAPLKVAESLAGENFSKGLALSQSQLVQRGLLSNPGKTALGSTNDNQKKMLKYRWVFLKDPAYNPELLKVSYFGKGSRKRSKAFAVLTKNGQGKILVNNREFIEYFNQPDGRFTVIRSLFAFDLCDKVDVRLYVNGGGTSSQPEACLIAISKALIAAFPHLEPEILERYFTFVDSRMVQPKNTGKYKARKSYTYVRR